MKGVEALFDDMLREDPEYTKLAGVKGLTDVTDFRDKYSVGTEELKTAMLKLADEKTAERALYQQVVDTAKRDKDADARQLIVTFEKRKKHTFRDVRHDPSRAEQVCVCVCVLCVCVCVCVCVGCVCVCGVCVCVCVWCVCVCPPSRSGCSLGAVGGRLKLIPLRCGRCWRSPRRATRRCAMS
jgi:hypothetical protein